MSSEKLIGGLMDAVFSRSPDGPESLGERKALAHIRSAIKHPNVVGLGVARKLVDGAAAGGFGLTVYVQKKLPLSKLKALEAVPAFVAHGALAPVPTDVVEIGSLKPDAQVHRTPIQPGFSVGHFGGDTGTLGAIVMRDGKFFVISNSHVLARAGLAAKGDAILFPGGDDGGKNPRDAIARLTDFVKLKSRGMNTVDTAIAEIAADRLKKIHAEVAGIGLISKTIKPKVGMVVEKLGRTSGVTQGTVVSAKFRPLRLPYDGIGNVSFEDQILFTRFTKPGDSGSLVVDVVSKKAVGLHFASASGGSVSAPIDRVLEVMGVQLAALASPAA
jgi:hypothetical protein